jgi:wyosine [tRNA(Phe)-imidazoG37] synthetase (radical SAM superfamily)
MKEMAYVFGPVPSRRLGWSLGIDLVPFKTCSFDCIYCQLGRTTAQTTERKEYVPVKDVLREVGAKLKDASQIDFVTLSGSGEPTLNSGLGEVIRGLKAVTMIPVAVLTNGSLLFDPQVRAELKAADLVIPSLDTVRDQTFSELNRPRGLVSAENMVEGIREFAHEFQGELWLEIMLVRGFNDGEEDISTLATVLKDLSVKKVQLNTVVRPPAEAIAKPLNRREMEKIAARLPGQVEIIGEFNSAPYGHGINRERAGEILALLKRRPCTLDDLAAFLGLHKVELGKYLGCLVEENKVQAIWQGGVLYYRVKA